MVEDDLNAYAYDASVQQSSFIAPTESLSDRGPELLVLLVERRLAGAAGTWP
jgi:hypothetical protein